MHNNPVTSLTEKVFSLTVSLTVSLYAYPAIILLSFLGMILFPFYFSFCKIITGWKNDQIMRLYVWLYGRGWVTVMLPFTRFKREGFDTFALEPPYIIVVNHYSFFDTYCMGLLPFHNISFAVRAWPFKMFWYAPFMRLARYLNVEMTDWSHTIILGIDILAKKGSVLFFPEGHRSRDGKLQRFFSGPFKLACDSGVKVLPVCLTGTDELLPPGKWLMRPSTIRMKALLPIDPSAFQGPLAHMELRKHTKRLMAEAIESMKEKR